jgi:3-hydroxyisobutyrate dehydrogenase-like beta-hydroxyacid dehydrogenase
MTFEEFAKRHLSAVLAFATVLAGERAAAEDLVHDVLIRASTRLTHDSKLPPPVWPARGVRSRASACETLAMNFHSGNVVGLLHPGEMGAAVGRCLTDAGYTVLWVSDGRSNETAARAAAAGLTDAGTMRDLTAQATLIISVCPPHAALDVAWAVHGFRGRYLDANAISPDTAREVAKLITGSGGRYVDGGIIGGPPMPPGGSTRLYLSGEDARDVYEMFEATPLEPRIASGSAVAASAVKMAYAAWTKGSAALLLTARALAEAEDVQDALLAEWALSQPKLADQVVRSAGSAATKGWRWVGEMEEIAHSMAAAGLPDGFHQAAAEVYRRVQRTPAADADQVLATVMAALTGRPPDSG